MSVPDFPLSVQKSSGQFCKKIKGRRYYFGPLSDPEAALRRYLAERDDLEAGRVPRPVTDSPLVADVFNLVLNAKIASVSDGWYKDYVSHLKRFAKFVGARRRVGDLRPSDFEQFVGTLDEFAANTRNQIREVIVAAFRYAHSSEWIAELPRFGPGFSKAPASEVRGERRERLLTPAQVRKLLSAADDQMRAMILLGLNGGFGPGDCAGLPMSAIDAGVIHYARTKTGIPRTVPLWPETKKAIAGIIKYRPDDSIVFRSKYGQWNSTSICHAFRDVADQIKPALESGVGMGALRHTFLTYAAETLDNDAVSIIMGHALKGIRSHYIEAVFLPRLRRVVSHVRSRLQIAKAVRDGR